MCYQAVTQEVVTLVSEREKGHTLSTGFLLSMVIDLAHGVLTPLHFQVVLGWVSSSLIDSHTSQCTGKPWDRMQQVCRMIYEVMPKLRPRVHSGSSTSNELYL